MNDTEWIIREINEFKKGVMAELKEIKSDVRDLQKSKWRMAGGITTLSVILAGLAEVIHKHF